MENVINQTASYTSAPRMDPATIVALISAAITAATAVSATVAGEVSKGASKNPIGCTIVNYTPDTLTKLVDYGQPVHGEMETVPLSRILSLQDGGDKDSDGKYQETNNVCWTLQSKNAGSETLMIYYSETEQIYMGFYAKNPQNGSPEVGVSLSSSSWFNDNKKDNDSKGEWLIDHIRKYHGTTFCQFGQGNYSVSMGPYIISFQAAKSALFEISYLDYQQEQQEAISNLSKQKA